METGEIAQTAIAILEGSGTVEDFIQNPLTSDNGFFNTIFQNDIWFWTTVVIFFFRIIALIRTIKDACSRSSSFRFHLLAALCIIILTPILGIPLYVAIRPQGWKWDKDPRRIAQLQQLQTCENCGNLNPLSNKFCIFCGESLQDTCRECQTKFSKNHSYCPNCGAPHLDV